MEISAMTTEKNGPFTKLYCQIKHEKIVIRQWLRWLLADKLLFSGSPERHALNIPSHLRQFSKQ